MMSLICGTYIKKNYIQNRNRFTGIESKLMVTKEEMWEEGRMNQELGMNTLNMDLLHSTGNSTQSSVITYIKKGSKTECIYVYT